MPQLNNKASWYQAAALLLVLFSFFMSAFISRTVFERLPHLEDEVAYLFQARTYARGQAVIPTPELRRAFWQPFVVDYQNPETGVSTRFGKYSPGWPLILMAGVWLGESWIINALLSALTVALVYRLGRELFDKDTGLIAAALTAFSPMALLLNGSLMGHTAALFTVTLFLYAYWRIEQRRQVMRWGILAGIALGLTVANRPLTGIAVALPLVAWSGVRLWRALLTARSQFWPILRPLLPLSVLTLLLAALVPIYSYLAAGDYDKNLYTLVWSYDAVGFGECCGRAVTRGEVGHTLAAGVRHARFDLSLLAADLYGWQLGTMTDTNGVLLPELREQLLNRGDYWKRIGLSWLLLPLGLLIGFGRKSPWFALWLLAGIGWLVFAFELNNGVLTWQKDFSYIWLVVAFAWLMLPALFLSQHQPRITWTWVLLSVVLGLVGVQLAYWIGSQRYSTRYYFEMLSAASLISALPVAWLARRLGRAPVYLLLLAALLYSLYFYSTPRITALYRFNYISREVIDEIHRRSEGDQPVLVLVEGLNVRWRAIGPLMAVTSPYLDSPIVGAWNYGGDETRQQILDRFPGRQVIKMAAEENASWFTDED